MEPTGGYAIWISLASLFVAVCTGTWNVVSWRRGGSHLRVHALLYRDVLLLWIFNAGRTADRVEEVVLGGRRGGIGGVRLTERLGGGFALQPGEARRFELDWRTAVPATRHRSLDGGYESVWLLLGSMRQRRAEVLALPNSRPPEVGWRLAPRSANWARYAPVILAVPLVLMSSMAERPGSAAVFGVILLMGLGAWSLLTTGFRSRRRKLERRFMYLGAIVLLPLSLEQPSLVATGWPSGLYVLGATVIAMPGWLPVVAGAGRNLQLSVARWLAHAHPPPGADLTASAEDSPPA